MRSLFILLILSGCGQSFTEVPPDFAKEAEELCLKNGGIKMVAVIPIVVLSDKNPKQWKVQLKCNNTAHFNYTIKREPMK